MKPLKAKDVPTVPFTETQAKARRLNMLIADIEASETYEHAYEFHFCGTPACAFGHFWANPGLHSEYIAAGHPTYRDNHSPTGDCGVWGRTAKLLGIDQDCFDDPSRLHNGTKAGVLAYLRSVRAEMG